jgi:SAM-dependent methyltransferase
MSETSKAKNRRTKEGWFNKYAPDHLSGIDLGCRNDPLNHTFRRWDLIFGDSDATFMKGVPDESFYTVYASHILEHLNNPVIAITNWYRILKKDGHLIICVPHRDLYEGKKTLPSKWNHTHVTFWLPEKKEPPHTLPLRQTVLEAIPNANIVSFKVLKDGWVKVPSNKHPVGEYSIEIIVKK